MIAIAPAHQPAFSPLPSCHDPENDFAPLSHDFTSLIDEESGLAMPTDLKFATPPQHAPMRRSIRKIRTSSKRTASGQPHVVKRTLSQKRRREHVSFRDDDLVQTRAIEAIPDDCKNEVWYDGKELNQLVFDEMRRNFQVRMIQGKNYPLEENNLTWRGLEEHIPSPNTEQNGMEARLEKIGNYVHIVLALDTALQEEAKEGEDISEELGERAALLSKCDRDAAIEKGQEDAFDALREHGVEHGPEPQDALVANYPDQSNGMGVIQTLVTWFCL